MSAEFYTRKCYFTYKDFEIFSYSSPVYTCRPKKLQKKREKLIKNESISSGSLSRTRQKLRRLVNTNSHLNKFITLTFADHITDVTEANNLFKKFILRLQYYYSDLAYIAVPEFTKIGRIHYHLLTYLPYIENKKLADIWSHGFVKINRIDKVQNVGLYISKYLGKDNHDNRLFGKKKYFTSKNLIDPMVLYDDDISDCMDMFNTKATYMKMYDTIYFGLCLFQSFSLIDDVKKTD